MGKANHQRTPGSVRRNSWTSTNCPRPIPNRSSVSSRRTLAARRNVKGTPPLSWIVIRAQRDTPALARHRLVPVRGMSTLSQVSKTALDWRCGSRQAARLTALNLQRQCERTNSCRPSNMSRSKISRWMPLRTRSSSSTRRSKRLK